MKSRSEIIFYYGNVDNKSFKSYFSEKIIFLLRLISFYFSLQYLQSSYRITNRSHISSSMINDNCLKPYNEHVDVMQHQKH